MDNKSLVLRNTKYTGFMSSCFPSFFDKKRWRCNKCNGSLSHGPCAMHTCITRDIPKEDFPFLFSEDGSKCLQCNRFTGKQPTHQCKNPTFFSYAYDLTDVLDFYDPPEYLDYKEATQAMRKYDNRVVVVFKVTNTLLTTYNIPQIPHIPHTLCRYTTN